MSLIRHVPVTLLAMTIHPMKASFWSVHSGRRQHGNEWDRIVFGMQILAGGVRRAKLPEVRRAES